MSAAIQMGLSTAGQRGAAHGPVALLQSCVVTRPAVAEPAPPAAAPVAAAPATVTPAVTVPPAAPVATTVGAFVWDLPPCPAYCGCWWAWQAPNLCCSGAPEVACVGGEKRLAQDGATFWLGAGIAGLLVANVLLTTVLLRLGAQEVAKSLTF